MPTRRIPDGVAWAMAAAAEGARAAALCLGWRFELLLTRQAVQAVCTTQTFSGAKARALLGYAPPVPPMEAQRRSVRYFLRHPDFPCGRFGGGGGGGSGGATARGGTALLLPLLLLLLLLGAVALTWLGAFEFTAAVPWRQVLTIDGSSGAGGGGGGGGGGDDGDGSSSTAAARGAGLLVVFEALAAAGSWPAWNTFTSQVALPAAAGGRLRAGDAAALDVALRLPLLGTRVLRALPFRVTEVVPPRPGHPGGGPVAGRICWSYQMVPELLQPLVLRTRRCMHVREGSGAGGSEGSEGHGGGGGGGVVVELRHTDHNVGPLAPLVRALFESAIEEGFEQMTADLKRHLAN